MPVSEKERQLLALVRSRDAELDLARGELGDQNQLLRASKAAIERLQDGLGEVRAENIALREEIKRATANHSDELDEAEALVTDLQHGLSSRSTLVTDLQAQVSKLQGDLSREREVRESEAEAAARKIREKERRVVALEADLDAEYRLGVSRDHTIKELREKVSLLEVQVHQVTGLLKDSEASLLKLREEKHVLEGEASGLRASMERSEAAERERSERQDKELLAKDQDILELRRSLQEIKSAHATALGSHEREWLSRAREVELHWEGKIRDSAQKHDEEQSVWESQLKDADRAWQEKLDELERIWGARVTEERRVIALERAQWESERPRIVAEAEARCMDKLKSDHAAQVVDLKQSAERDREALDRSWAVKAQDSDLAWSKSLSEATQRWAAESAAKEEEWALARAGMEVMHAAALEAERIKAINAESDLRGQHKAVVEESARQWDKEREALKETLTSEANRALAEARKRHEGLQTEAEDKASALNKRVAELAAREAGREAIRQQLSRQLEDLQDTFAEEIKRRSEGDSALREQVETLTAQVRDLNRQLDDAQRELREAHLKVSLASVRHSSPARPLPSPDDDPQPSSGTQQLQHHQRHQAAPSTTGRAPAPPLSPTGIAPPPPPPPPPRHEATGNDSSTPKQAHAVSFDGEEDLGGGLVIGPSRRNSPSSSHPPHGSHRHAIEAPPASAASPHAPGSPLTRELLAAKAALDGTASVAYAARFAATAAWPPPLPPPPESTAPLKAPSTICTVNDAALLQGGMMYAAYPKVSPSELAAGETDKTTETTAALLPVRSATSPSDLIRAQQRQQWDRAAEGLERLVREVRKDAPTTTRPSLAQPRGGGDVPLPPFLASSLRPTSFVDPPLFPSEDVPPPPHPSAGHRGDSSWILSSGIPSQSSAPSAAHRDRALEAELSKLRAVREGLEETLLTSERRTAMTTAADPTGFRISPLGGVGRSASVGRSSETSMASHPSRLSPSSSSGGRRLTADQARALGALGGRPFSTPQPRMLPQRSAAAASVASRMSALRASAVPSTSAGCSSRLMTTSPAAAAAAAAGSPSPYTRGSMTAKESLVARVNAIARKLDM